MTQQLPAKDTAMLNSDHLMRCYRTLVSLTACTAIAYCFLVIVSMLTAVPFPRSLNVLHSLLFGRALMLITEVTLISRGLRQLAEASHRSEVMWLRPDPTTWSTAIIALLGMNIAYLQNNEPASWSIGVALLFFSWDRTISATFRETDKLTLNDQEQANLKRLRHPNDGTPTAKHLVIFLISQLSLALFGILTPPSALTNSLCNNMVALGWPISMALGIMYLSFAGLSLSTNQTHWWLWLATLLPVEFTLILCIASVRAQSIRALIGPFLRV